MKPTPKAMTPSAAYPYFDEKPMQFRGVKVRASPKVSHLCVYPWALLQTSWPKQGRSCLCRLSPVAWHGKKASLQSALTHNDGAAYILASWACLCSCGCSHELSCVDSVQP